MLGAVEIVANVVLFLSSLLLLIDVAPHDFLPRHKQRVRAFDALRERKNILRKLSDDINIKPGSGEMSIIQDNESYEVLAEFIRLRAPLAQGIDWSKAVGVGYAIQSIPVGGSKLEAFKPLYVALTPDGGETELNLVPVGQLGDIPTWLAQQRMGSVTRLAMALLVVGFLLQLICSIVPS